MRWWLLAMAKYPDIQRKAQAELDNVIGKDRLPDFNDRPSMPYLEAMLKETLRWGTVTPLGILYLYNIHKPTLTVMLF